MGEHVVGTTDEVPEGERLVVQVEGREIGVFNVDGEYYAYTNWCAHQSGPICEGSLTGTMFASLDPETHEVTLEWSEEGNILNCPWHGWEYNITNGECIPRKGISLPSHDIEVRDGDLILTV